MILKKWLRGATVAATLMAALGTGLVVAGPANAAQPHSIASHAVQVRIPVQLQPNAPAVNIDCWTTLGGPVVQGFNLVVAATAWCNYPVTSLVLNVYLYWNGNLWGSGLDVSKQAVAAAAKGTCISGAFYGKMVLEIAWPPGVVGPPTYSQSTALVNIDANYDC